MKPVIIAECCQNHNGDKEILKKQIHLAVENGADYVKIQAIRSRELTHRKRFDEGQTDLNGNIKIIKRPFQQEFNRLRKLDLSLETEFWFVQECRRAGILPMTTAFTLNAADEIKNMGYEAIKIASYDCSSYSLLKKVKKYWDKVFVSTGSTYDNEIEKAASILNDVQEFHLLHCVTIYPTPLSEQNLKRLDFLRNFTNYIGFSDHSLVSKDGLIASKIALALGAISIERHFTILEKDQTKDGPVSITPKLLKELSEFSKLSREEMMQILKYEYPNWEISLGNIRRKLSDEELLNRDYYRGRFASKIDGKIVYNWE